MSVAPLRSAPLALRLPLEMSSVLSVGESCLTIVVAPMGWIYSVGATTIKAMVAATMSQV